MNTMTWTLSELAAIAEILGLIAIVPSLIFVGVQLARGNREARAATYQAAMKSEIDVSAILVEHAGTWDKVMTGAPLASGEELREGIVLFNVLMSDSEGRYHQFKAGYLDVQSWDARRSALASAVFLPIFEIWRSSPGGLSHSADFLALLDGMASRDASPDTRE